MLFKTWLGANISKGVLHWHAVGSYHSMCVNMYDVDVVEGLDKVGARDNLAGLMERDLRESGL
jgi:hypothetical protein